MAVLDVVARHARCVRPGDEPSSPLEMALPENMSSPDLTRKRTIDDMAVAPAGATAPDRDQPNFKRTLSKTVSPQHGTTESDNDKNCTLTTDEKRATRECHIVAPQGCDPTATPEQICRTMIGKIDALPMLSTGLRTSTMDSTSAESMTSTAEALDNLKTHISIFMKHVLDKMLQKDVEELEILMPLGTYLLAQVTSLAARATGPSPPPPPSPPPLPTPPLPPPSLPPSMTSPSSPPSPPPVSYTHLTLPTIYSV